MRLIAIAFALRLVAPLEALQSQAATEPQRYMVSDARPKFDVLIVKPSDPAEKGKKLTVRGRHVLAVNMNVNDLMTFAYDLTTKQLVDSPKWFTDQGFDLDGIPDAEGRPNTIQLKLLIQSALTERFNLSFHTGKRELAVYALTVAKGGPKLVTTTHQASELAGFNIGELGDVTVTNETMRDFCNGLQSAVLDRPVVDQTGLTLRYDFRLKWTPDESQFAALGPRVVSAPQEDASNPPHLPTAIREQIGLRLDSVRALADVFIIDRVERPTPN